MTEHIGLQYVSAVNAYSNAFSKTIHHDMVVRLARLYFVKEKEVVKEIQQHTIQSIQCAQGNITLKAIININYDITLHVVIKNPTFLPYEEVDIMVCPILRHSNDNTGYTERVANVLSAKEVISSILLKDDVQVSPSKNIESDLMEWLMDYTNIEDEIDL